MINKKISSIVALISFLFLISCGYQPIFSSNKSVFSIEKINLVEKNNINSRIKNALKVYQKKENAGKFYDLKISSKRSKIILTKDSKGDPKIFALNIIIKIDVLENNFLKESREFKKTLNYNNNSNKFDLKRYENKITSNLTNKVIEEIIIYLQSI